MPLAIDLYCGLGGWAEGFLAEGYDVIGFDIERFSRMPTDERDGGLNMNFHVCRFDSADDISGKKRTYKAVKQRVLECGRYSVFEATSSAANAKLFTSLDNDPELERYQLGYPWVGIRKRS